MIKRILVANRGEIAIRVMRAAKEMGIETVAIYHEVDKTSHHLNFATQICKIEGITPKAAYLDIDQIIKVAKLNYCQAIHPGYGFLSENADFSEACEKNGIIFIGPKADSIRAMGSKTQARQIMFDAGVPIVPGTLEPITNQEHGKKIADEIGYPVLLKAAAGGGGKGMRIVKNEQEFSESFESAQREALNSFKDDSIYIEKLIENAKHIEIQLIADTHNNYVHLGERDCSVQRRHQKLIEECPSTVLDDELRQRMGTVALNAARAVDYINAGTVEFLLDKDKNFYFLEMNTRLQVEHPVTELVTGIDLVCEQISIAMGNPLSFTQSDIQWKGHSIECRINAEDPYNDFMPDIGKILYYQEPQGNGVRLDSGVSLNNEITMYFDPMIAKLSVYASNRDLAIKKMMRALDELVIGGLRTNIPFHKSVLRHSEFTSGNYSTNFLTNIFYSTDLPSLSIEESKLLAALAVFFKENHKPQCNLSRNEDNKNVSNWKQINLNRRRFF